MQGEGGACASFAGRNGGSVLTRRRLYATACLALILVGLPPGGAASSGPTELTVHHPLTPARGAASARTHAGRPCRPRPGVPGQRNQVLGHAPARARAAPLRTRDPAQHGYGEPDPVHRAAGDRVSPVLLASCRHARAASAPSTGRVDAPRPRADRGSVPRSAGAPGAAV